MNSNSRTMNSMKNITTGIVGQLIQTILGFVSRTIFIKYLSVSYLGINGLFTNILSLLSLAELGVGSAIIYALYKPLADKDERQISSLMNFYAKAYRVIGSVVAIVGLSILPFLHVFIRENPNIEESIYVIYLFFLFNTVITYFFSYKTSIIIADQKGYVTGFVSYGIAFIQTIIQILILVITKNFILYLIVQAICSCAYNIIISIIADRMYSFLKDKQHEQIEADVKMNLMKNIKSLVIVKLSGVLVNNTDNIIVTYFSGLATVGVLSNYNLLINIVNTVLAQIFGGLTASVGNLNAKEDNEKKEHLFNIINLSNFWLFGFSTICIIVLSNDFINLWLGEKYILSQTIVVVLAINFYMIGMQNAVWTYKNTMGLFVYGRFLLLFTAAINLVLSIILGNSWGLLGILLATAIARLITNIWYDPHVVYKYGFYKSSKCYFLKYGSYLLVLIGTTTITTYLCSFLNLKVNFFFFIMLKFVICIVVINIIFYLFFYRTVEFQYIKRSFYLLLFKDKGKKTGLQI